MTGIGTITAAEVFSERVELQPRTSDPSNTEEGEGWIRSDVAPETDQIGTLRFDTGSGVIDLPIFDTAASAGSDIKTHLRVPVGGAQGFVPTTDDGATRPKVGVWDSGTRYGANDSLSAIPDSVVVQHFATTFSQGDGTWTDDDGAADIAIAGDPQTGTLSDGDESVNFDGTNDYGLMTLPSSLEGSSLNAFSYEVAGQWTTSNNFAAVIGIANSGNSQFIQVALNRNGNNNTEVGNITFQLTDKDTNDFNFGPASNPNLNDGTRVNILFVVEDAANNNASIYINGSEKSITVGSSESPSSFGSWDVDCALAARNIGGTVGRETPIDIGAERFHDEAISSPTIGNYS